MSLNNLALRLSELGRRDEALAPAQEAVIIYRKLAQKNPDAFLPDLARSLGTFGGILMELERVREAARNFKEGLDSLLPVAERLPAAFAPLLRALLRGYVRTCQEGGIVLDTSLADRAEQVLAKAK